MQLNPYLTLAGECEAAFTRYQQIFGGQITAMIRHAGTPAACQVPPEWGDKIMHVCLDMDGRLLMGSDAPPGRFQPPQGFAVQVAAETPEEAERVFAALGQGGTITMALQQTFWAERFGMLVDAFGVPWMVNCEAKAGTPSATESGQRAAS